MTSSRDKLSGNHAVMNQKWVLHVALIWVTRSKEPHWYLVVSFK